jgi:hypothetical protein
MPEKQLVESFWKTFAKGKTYKDDALLKALQALAKSEKGSPEDQIEALESVGKQMDLLRKANKADKELGKQLDDMESALDRQRKSADALLKQAKKDAASAGEEEEEDSPALLTTKMIPLIRVLRKGELRLRATICNSGPNTAVLITRRSITASTKKVMAEYIDAKGGSKYFVGEVFFEKGALTFVMEGSASGLAKRIQRALLAQTELRLRVRVRGDDGEEVDGEDGEEAAAQGTPPQAPPAPSAEQLALTQRVLKIKPALETALKSQHPEATKLRALSGFVSEKSAAGDTAGALKALEMLEKLLAVPTSSPSTGTTDDTKSSEGPGVDPAKAFKERLAALMPKLKTAPPEVKAKAAQAGNFAAKRDFEAAQAVLDDIEEALEGQPSPSGDTEKPEDAQRDPKQAEYEGLLSRLEPLHTAITKASKPPEAAEQFKKLDGAWGLAMEAAGAKNYDRALQVLRRLEETQALAKLAETLKAGAGGGEPSEGPRKGSQFAYAMSALSYRDAFDSVSKQIAALKSAIPAAVPDERDLADELADELEEHKQTVLDAVDEAMTAAKEDRPASQEQLIKTLDMYITDVASNPLIKHVDNNPFGVNMSIEATLSKALKTIRQAIPA